MAVKGPDIIAAIDVGTNSFHMVIASASTKGTLSILARNRETVRLGSSPGDMKRLSDEAMKRGVDTLKRYASEAHHHNARIRAVATSAVREAANREQFVGMIKAETGIDLEVVSGVEEGRLIYIGALHALPILTTRALVIDIGGGSTETIIGYEGETQYVNSAKLGHIRMTKRFFSNGDVKDGSIERCRAAIRGEWAPVFQPLIAYGFEAVVGCSGTITAIATVCLALQEKRIPDSLNGLVLSRNDLLKTIAVIADAKSTSERAEIPGLEAKRAEVILGGALILEQAIIGLNIQQLTISNYALREGIVFDTAQQSRDIKEYHHLSHLRYQSVDHLCELYRVRRPHAEHVKNIALHLFDSLRHLHPCGDKEREILEAAALLHDVGYHISADQHHKHSDYLIRNSPMPGFTNDETELIATVARYHRKSHPKKKHNAFALLQEEEQEVVRVLASILRIAEGLDRRQQQHVQRVDVQSGDDLIEITLYSPLREPDIEMWGAERRKSLMEETFDCKVRLLNGSI